MSKKEATNQDKITRRSFFKYVGGASIAALVSGSVPGLLARAQEEVKIGLLGPLQLFQGIDIKRAGEIAADEINANGGILGKKVSIAFGDSEAQSEQAIKAVRKLAVTDKVDAIIGGFRSGAILATVPHIAKYRIPFLGTGAASPDICEFVAKDYDKYKYIFRVYPINAARQAINCAAGVNDILFEEVGFTKFAITPENYKWARDYEETLKRELEIRYGLEIVYEEFHDPAITDFSPIFSKAADSGAQALVMIISAEQGYIIAKQWHDQQPPFVLTGNNNPSFLSDFWEKTEGKCEYEYDTWGVKAPITEKSVPFKERFEKKYGVTPFYTGMGAYDALYVLTHAAERAGTVEADPLVEALEETDYKGVIGRIVFDVKHDVKYGLDFVPIPMGQWQNGVKVGLWPRKFAVGSYKLPPWLR